MKAANQLGLPKGTIIYFAVDFDAYDYQVTSHVLPYFYSLSQRMRALEVLIELVYMDREIFVPVSVRMVML